ncbi:hypothetical protein [Gordonia paraffinivorans]|uniref:hypothetical protein n=1 Tax=Gordonia paraffinivorans TaxID=175628 RepID=UPI001E348830|nr:hypothetical protein [Gordonia paraffinivorans]MCD2145159.1 hypothetical protein [Gordonia paraffinivorans]
MSADLLDAARDLTGFDARRVRSGDAVLVLGTEGVGVRTLVEACRSLAADLDFRARDTAESADRPAPGVAVIVVDPSSSVGEEEKRLLDGARARVGTVALVCSRIDAFWEWPRVVRAHRKSLDPFGTLPVFGVSAAAALGGAADESGVDELISWIRQALDAPATVRDARARVSAGIGAVEHLLCPEAPAAADGDGLDDLLARRRELLAGRDRGRPDRLAALRAGLARARAQSAADLTAGVRELSALAADSAPGTRHREWLQQRWSELSTRLQRATDERIDEVSATTLVGLDPEPAARPPWTETPLPADGAARRRRTGAEDALLVVIGASTGLGVGRLVVAPMASVQTLQWISMPLTLLLGVAVAAWIIRVRRGALDRAGRAARDAEQLAAARAALDHQLGLRVAAAETAIAGQIGRAYERRARRVDEQVARIDESVRRLRGGAVAGRERQRAERARAVHRDLTALVERMWTGPVGGNDSGVDDGNR